MDVNNNQVTVNQLTVSLAYTQCLVGFMNEEIVQDEVDIFISLKAYAYGKARPLESGISLVKAQKNRGNSNSKAKRKTVRWFAVYRGRLQNSIFSVKN